MRCSVDNSEQLPFNWSSFFIDTGGSYITCIETRSGYKSWSGKGIRVDFWVFPPEVLKFIPSTFWEIFILLTTRCSTSYASFNAFNASMKINIKLRSTEAKTETNWTFKFFLPSARYFKLVYLFIISSCYNIHSLRNDLRYLGNLTKTHGPRNDPHRPRSLGVSVLPHTTLEIRCPSFKEDWIYGQVLSR